MIKKFGPIYIDFDEYPTYSGTISENFETNVNVNIQRDHGYVYSSSKEKICAWINEESWEIMQKYFPNTKQIKNTPKQQYAKNVHMFKMIEIKLMKFLIYHQITNIPFQHHIFTKNL